MFVNDTLVAINLYDHNTNILYNKSLVPILFYWNGKGELLDNIFHDDKFKENYLNNICDYANFLNLEMSFFHFVLNDNGEEEYYDKTVLVSEHLSLKDFNSDKIIFNLVIPHLYNLYKMAMKEDYDDVKVFNKEIIIDIYQKIKNKYNDKIEKPTLLNWLRSELINQNKIDSNNINYIITKLNNILQNED